MKTIITLLVLVLLFACKAERSESAAVADSAPVADSSGAPAHAVATPASVVQRQRQIVRTATMRIVVADTAKAVNDVTAAVQALDGYVSGSEIWREGELLRARLTLRVPGNSLNPALAAIRKASRRVDNETMSSEDVTQAYVDLEARLRNLEATELELRELLRTVRQNARKAAEILEVHQQLTVIRGEIEQTRGRIQHLGHNVAMSHIGLEVMPDAITKPVVETAWQPAVIAKDATRALLSAARTLAAAGIWIVIYVIPVCGMLALAMVAIWSVTRRFWRRNA